MSDSQYNRPNRTWVCGHEKDGFCCRLGPSRKGACQAGPQCDPVKVSGKWKCSRPAHMGGACVEGPKSDGSCCTHVLQCQPRLSLHAKRKRISMWTSAFVLGLLALLVAGRQTDGVLMPGQLTAAHGAISKDCAKCHSTASDGIASFAPALFKFGRADAHTDSELCLKCHDLGASAFKMHSLSTAELEKIGMTANADTGKDADIMLTISRALFLDTSNVHDDVSCQTCHLEHQGREHNLSAISDNQCQFCHTVTFDRFSNGHPDFISYPYERRTRIIFDHRSHMKKYFLQDKKGEKIDCVSCHSLDERGSGMRSAGFDESCSSCHLNEIRGEGQGVTGVSFLQVPELDLESLRAKKVHIGAWPSNADGILTPYAALLLRANPEAASHLEAIQDLELFDLSEASEEQLASVKYVAWSLKKLFSEIAKEGQIAISARLRAVAGQTFSESEMSGFLSGFPASLFKLANADWFPKLENELGRVSLEDQSAIGLITLRTRGVANSPAEFSSDLLEEELVGSGGWYVDGFGIFYRPAGHRDDFLKHWLELTLRNKKQWETLWSQLGDENAPGRCTYCHSIESNGESFEIEWKGWRPPVDETRLTKFEHASHMTVMKEGGCASCHRYDPDADYLEGYKQHDSKLFKAQFLSIDKSQCTECHTEKQAGEDCLTCHEYHVTKP